MVMKEKLNSGVITQEKRDLNRHTPDVKPEVFQRNVLMPIRNCLKSSPWSFHK
jgi:hypothetical protein